MKRTLTLLLAAVTLALATGCTQTYLYDDVDLVFDFGFTQSDTLALPYVVGANVRISVSDGEEGDEEHAWRLESSNPAVLRVDAQAEGSAECVAVGAGSSTITVRDQDGEVVHEGEVEVKRPDRIELWAHGPVIVDAGGLSNEVRMVEGGTATYLVRYYAGSELLHGNGTLDATLDGDLAAPREEQTFIFENREWLQVDAFSAGQGTLTLSAGGQPVSSLPLTVVTSGEVATLELMHDRATADAEEGSSLTVLAMARDDQGRAVYGVEVSWDLDGDGQEGLGDLFRYSYQPQAQSVLGASYNGLRADTTIHADSGYVDSSNDLGCSASGAGPSPASWLLALLAAVAIRRPRLALP